MAKATQAPDSTQSGAEPPEIVAENPILYNKVWGKMHLHNDNWMGAIVGETGSGKSWAGLRLCEAVDPDFTIDQVAFDVVEFLRLVNDDSLGRGSMILFEEASVEASADSWQSKGNKVLRRVLDTWRHQNRGAAFTLPAFGNLDAGARGRMSALMQMFDKQEHLGYTVSKYKWIDQDTDTGKLYKKYPRLGGKKYKYLKIRKPSKELREAYEQRKREYTNELNQRLLNELLEEMGASPAADEESDALPEDPPGIAEHILSEKSLSDYVGDNHGQLYIDRDWIEMDYGIGAPKSKKVKKVLMREVGSLEDLVNE